MKYLRITIIFSFIIISSFSDLSACTCIYRSMQKIYTNSSAIFIGEAIRVIEDSKFYPDRPFVFKITQNFKNANQDSIVVCTGYGGGDCGYPFEIGKKYLVFTNEYEGINYTGTCSGTKDIELAKYDLIFLDNLPDTMNETYIVGTIYYWVNNQQTFEEISKVADTKVILRSSDKSFITSTDKDGFYMFKNIPNGKYSVRVDFKKELVFSDEKRETIIIDETEFHVVPLTLLLPCTLAVNLSDNVNSTSLYWKTSKSLIPVTSQGKKGAYQPIQGFINVSGNKIIFDRIPEGKYKFGINTSPHDVSGFYPYHTQYYPNAESLQQADIITFTSENRYVEIDMHLTRIPVYHVKGSFFTNDSIPLPDVDIGLRSSKDYYNSEPVAKGFVDNNQFEIELLENIEGWLHFEILGNSHPKINANDYQKIEPYQIYKNTNIDNLMIEIKAK